MPPGRNRQPLFAAAHDDVPRVGDGDEVKARDKVLGHGLRRVSDSTVCIVDVDLPEQVREAVAPRVGAVPMAPTCQNRLADSGTVLRAPRRFGLERHALSHGWVTKSGSLVDNGILGLRMSVAGACMDS